MEDLIKNADAARYNMGIVGVNLPDLPTDVPLEESPYVYTYEGDTYSARSDIKAAGGRWNPEDRIWEFKTEPPEIAGLTRIKIYKPTKSSQVLGAYKEILSDQDFKGACARRIFYCRGEKRWTEKSGCTAESIFKMMGTKSMMQDAYDRIKAQHPVLVSLNQHVRDNLDISYDYFKGVTL